MGQGFNRWYELIFYFFKKVQKMPDTIYTNDKNFRAMMLKCGYTNEDIRQVHLKELHDNGICVLTF